MSEWKPDNQLEQLVTGIIVTRRDEMTRHIRNEASRLAEQLAVRGLGQSGAEVYGHDALNVQAYDECVQSVITAVLELFRDVFGEIPVEATPWIRRTLTQFIDGLADSVISADRERRQRASIGGHSEAVLGPKMKARQRLDLDLGKLEVKARLRELTPPERPAIASADGADIFICHASEDKAAAARPIAEILRTRGYRVWLDETELKVGDRLLDKIDDGLATCRFGVVILSRTFFDKPWARRELAGLVAREIAEERPVILPVWLDVDVNEIVQRMPTLANIIAANMNDGVEKVVEDIVRVLGAPNPHSGV